MTRAQSELTVSDQGAWPGPQGNTRPTGSRPAGEGTPELVEVNVVVRGHQCDSPVDGHATPRRVDPGALPLLGREAAKECQRLPPPLAKMTDRLADIVPQILALLRPPIGTQAGPGEQRRFIHDRQLLDA